MRSFVICTIHPSTIRIMKARRRRRRRRWAGRVARIEKKRDMYRLLVGRP
jgi:hypothetical protein